MWLVVSTLPFAVRVVFQHLETPCLLVVNRLDFLTACSITAGRRHQGDSQDNAGCWRLPSGVVSDQCEMAGKHSFALPLQSESVIGRTPGKPEAEAVWRKRRLRMQIGETHKCRLYQERRVDVRNDTRAGRPGLGSQRFVPDCRIHSAAAGRSGSSISGEIRGALSS